MLSSAVWVAWEVPGISLHCIGPAPRGEAATHPDECVKSSWLQPACLGGIRRVCVCPEVQSNERVLTMVTHSLSRQGETILFLCFCRSICSSVWMLLGHSHAFIHRLPISNVFNWGQSSVIEKWCLAENKLKGWGVQSYDQHSPNALQLLMSTWGCGEEE